jgi:ABC-2 type transport system ATP-binding protein
MLEVRNLRKTYGSIVAVDDVSFGVGRGELVAVLGPNGAGKTTTVSIISGLVTPDLGEVSIGGARLRGDADPLKRRIGLVPQDIALYDELSARDNLRFFGALFGLGGKAVDTAIHSVLAWVGLAERARPRRHLQRRDEKAAQSGRRSAARSRHPAARRADGRRGSPEP